MTDQEMAMTNGQSAPADEVEATNAVVTGKIRVRPRTTRAMNTIRRVAPDPLPEIPTNKRPLRVARMLAFGHQLRKYIEGGVIDSEEVVAERLQVTPGRISQILDLTYLAPDIQEEILFWEVEQGRDLITEYGLRSVVTSHDWVEQRMCWKRLTENSQHQ